MKIALAKDSDAQKVNEQDIAAIEAVLRRIDQRNAQLESFAYWKLALRVFKELDLRFALAKNRSQMEPTHRGVLTSLLGHTERLSLVARGMAGGELERIGLTEEAIDANLKYLRSKYQQWYGIVDPATIEAVNNAIENGTGSASGKNL